MGYYHTITDISEHVTLFQLMYYLGNVNHDIGVWGTGYMTQTTKKHLYLIKNHWV